MKVLAIDTTEASCSAALLIDGEVIERFQIAPRQHSELILPMVEAVLAEAELSLTQLDCLGVARGPGSFTGVRIATAVTQGLSVAADLPVVPVSSLLGLAQGAARVHQASHVLASFDARMKEVYWTQATLNDTGVMALQSREQVCSVDKVSLPISGKWFAAGSAWAEYSSQLEAACGSLLEGIDAGCFVHAQDVAILAEAGFIKGEAVDVDEVIPIYLRDDIAKKSTKKLF